MKFLMSKLITMNADKLFSSAMGDVSQKDLINSLKIMGLGMLGIFVVMIAIYLVIVLLNKFTKNK